MHHSALLLSAGVWVFVIFLMQSSKHFIEALTQECVHEGHTNFQSALGQVSSLTTALEWRLTCIGYLGSNGLKSFFFQLISDKKKFDTMFSGDEFPPLILSNSEIII